MATIISIVNHKGGVGKTTTSMNLSYALAQLKHKKVLVIDLDAQANLSTSLGFIPANYTTLYDILPNEGELPIYPVHENLDIVLSSLDLAASEMNMINEIGREKILANLIEPIESKYDYIIIDCPPSLGLLTINALSASDKVVIVVESEFLALEGQMRLPYTIDIIKKKLNKKLDVLGVLQTKYDSRLSLTKRVEESLKEIYGEKLFETRIRKNVALAEAPSERKTIFEYDPGSNGSQDYLALAEEVITRTEKK